MDINFLGYNENVVTFKVNGTINEGDFVKMYSSDTVAACSDGDDFIGVAVNVRNGFAAVQTAGYVEAAASAAVDVGYNTLAISDGVIAESETGREYLVIHSDSTTVGFIL